MSNFPLTATIIPAPLPNLLSRRVLLDLTEAGHNVEELLASHDSGYIMELWLQWNGILGYTRDIIAALDSIRRATGEVL